MHGVWGVRAMPPMRVIMSPCVLPAQSLVLAFLHQNLHANST